VLDLPAPLGPNIPKHSPRQHTSAYVSIRQHTYGARLAGSVGAEHSETLSAPYAEIETLYSLLPSPVYLVEPVGNNAVVFLIATARGPGIKARQIF
jgi:hypothetical protein